MGFRADACGVGLVRFVPRGDGSSVLIGQPVDSQLDVGKAVRKGEEVRVQVFSGTSVLEPGSQTDRVETIDKILSPLSASEVGSIRCIGLNVCFHRSRNVTHGLGIGRLTMAIVCQPCQGGWDGAPDGAHDVHVGRKPANPLLPPRSERPARARSLTSQ